MIIFHLQWIYYYLLKKNKLKRYLHVGTCDEYGQNLSPIKENYREDPITSYAVAKLASINLLTMLYKTENFPATILRLFLVYGPHQKNDRLIPQVINGCLKKKNFPVSELFLIASAKSAGKKINFKGEDHTVIDLEKFETRELFDENIFI